MNKIRIAFLYSSCGFGGIVRNLSLLTGRLDPSRFEVCVISLANKGDLDSDITVPAGAVVNVFRIDERHRFDAAALRRVRGHLDDHHIDILSCHGYKADLYGCIIRAHFRPRMRLVAMVHGWTMAGVVMSFYHCIDKLVLRFFDKIILVSQGLAGDLTKFGVPSEKIVVIPNAVDDDMPDAVYDRSCIRRRFGLNENERVVCSVGRLGKEKDLRTSLRAMREVCDRIPDARLLIIGDGPERSALQKLVVRMRLEKAVIFAGYQKDVHDVYHAIDAYLSTSLTEGSPNSLLEAQAAGVPCVVSSVRGNNDIVTDGYNGLLAGPGKYRVFAEKIVTLFFDRDLAGRISCRAREVVRERFSFARRIGDLERLYTDLYKG